jgi:predicted Zn-dependent protease with MMP-like domain
MISSFDRQLFDRHLDRVMSALPDRIHAMLEEVPLIVEDEPSRGLLADLGLDPRHDDLCGLHSGVPLTERSVEALPSIPDQIMVFRGPILRMSRATVPGTGRDATAELARQIRITVLHEVGHHFGLDEDDLAALGYA